MSYLSGMLTVKQVLLHMQSEEKTGALRELARLAPDLKHSPRDLDAFVTALLERERLHTTAIGEGVALPHTRNPLGNILTRPLLVFGRHLKGIPFAAGDNKPVRLFFLLAAPSLTEHLKMLANLSRVLRNATIRTDLLNAAREVDVLNILAETEQRIAK